MIGIITFINENNYGAVLQGYSMYQFLSENGIESEFINIKLKNDNKIWTKLVFLRKNFAFKRFRKNLKIYNKKDYGRYNKIIVGSDQVWNPIITGNKLDPIFFGVGTDCQVVAYACSCGNTKVLDGYITELKDYIKNISRISVREASLKEFLEDKINTRAEVVLDPVFLTSENRWKNFIGEKKICEEKYIFVYLLENSDDITNAIEEISEKYKLKVITLRNKKHYKNEIKRFPAANPKEFLQLLSNAEIVVSNSFHALAFSFIFKRKIALFPHSQFNDRIDNLIESINLPQNCYYKNSKNIINFHDIKYVGTIEEEIEKSKKYLLEALNDDK